MSIKFNKNIENLQVLIYNSDNKTIYKIECY